MKSLPALLLTAALSAHAAHAAPLTVVELFQSQGCSSCPPANEQFLKALQRPDILGLSFQVTYWNYLGWADSFAKSAFDRRQYAYATGLHHDGVFTPQVVVNGRIDGPGTDEAAFNALLAEGGHLTGPSLSAANHQVTIGAGTGSGDVLLVRYDPALVMVPVARGENGGHTLPHRNIVRELISLGTWHGLPASFALPPDAPAGLNTAILLQAGEGGPILAAAGLRDPAPPIPQSP